MKDITNQGVRIMTPTELLMRSDLSWKAKALALTISVMGEHFDDPKQLNKVEFLAEIGKERASSVLTGLTELDHAGILTRTTVRSDKEGGPSHVVGSTWKVDVKMNHWDGDKQEEGEENN